jgi:hypothetical protein
VEDDVTIIQDLNTWKSKILCGKFPNPLQECHVDKESSLLWLSAGYVSPETGSFAVTIHDGVIENRNYQKHCLGVEMIYRCRKYGTVGKTTEHVIGACSSLFESSYLRKHNQLAKIIHQQIAIKYKLLDRKTLLYYRFKPALVLESANMISYWDRSMIIDKMVDLNRPDIVPNDNKTAL